MHIISGLKKRCLGPASTVASATGEAPSVSSAKKPTAKEMREEEIRARLEQTRKNIALATSGSEGGNDSDNHGSEDGVPPEVALEDLREAAREADIAAAEQREMEQAEDKACDKIGDSSSVEEAEDALSHCSPPTNYTHAEKEAWANTVVVAGQCHKEGSKVPMRIPSDLDGKWNYAQKALWRRLQLWVEK